MPGSQLDINLTPTGEQRYIANNKIDVIRQCEWAIFDGANFSKAADEVPAIYLNEYQPIGDQFATRAVNFIKKITTSFGGFAGEDAYKDLYRAKPTGNEYTFPFFTPEMRTKSSTWAQDTSLKDLGNTLISNFGSKWANGATWAGEKIINYKTGSTLGQELPKIWQGADASATYTFDFYLHNTISIEQTIQHYKLVYLLSYNNSYNRRTLLLQDAPCLYQVVIPGVRSSPAASMKDLRIDMVGQIRKLNGFPGINGDINLPEAYHITITMEDLFVESRTLLNKVTEGTTRNDVVKVFSESTPAIGQTNFLGLQTATSIAQPGE